MVLVAGSLPVHVAPGTQIASVRQTADAAAFCVRWPDARAALRAEPLETIDEGLQDRDEVAAELLATIHEVERLVPPDIRDEWDVAAGFRRGVTELLLTLEFVSERVRPVHLELAFGDADPERLEARAAASVDAIDQWTVTGCGDFCARWPEIEAAVRITDRDLHEGPAEVLSRERDEAELRAIIDPLVPEALRSAWDEAREWRGIATDAIEAEPDRPWEIDRYFEDRGLDLNFGTYLEELDRRLEPMVAWVGANCEGVIAGAGGPGTLTVQVRLTPEMVGSHLVVAVVPTGAPVTGLETNADLLGGDCRGVGTIEPETELTMIEPRGTRSLCDFLAGAEGVERARLDGGTYDVVALTVLGLGNGDLGSYLPAPELCTRFPVAVGGDTVVEVPPLEPCTLGPLAGDPDDVEGRRAPLVDPSEPGAGTVTVVLADAISPIREPGAEAESQDAAGPVVAVALPAGTDLDEVGRRAVWPSGVVCMETFNPEYVDRIDDPQDRDRLTGPHALPLTALPPTGHPPACFQPFSDLAGLLARGGPDPAVFAPGAYDLYLEVSEELGRVSPADSRCHQRTVTVDGDVSVEVPSATEWGECP